MNNLRSNSEYIELKEMKKNLIKRLTEVDQMLLNIRYRKNKPVKKTGNYGGDYGKARTT